MPRFSRAELEAARSLGGPDLVPGRDDPPLQVLFCGITPGLVTAITGHHFARPGNRFWPALHGAGFTPRLLTPYEDMDLLEYGCGITNMVDRPTRGVADLSDDEMRLGGQALAKLAATFRPAVIAVVGVTAWRVAYGRPEAGIGLQEETVGGCPVWVLPNPSGLNAHYQPPDLIRLFGELRAWVRAK